MTNFRANSWRLNIQHKKYDPEIDANFVMRCYPFVFDV